MKKFIALFLSAVLAFSLSAAVFAKGTGECDCGYVPVIYVSGFGQTSLVANAGTDDEYRVFFPENEMILELVKKLIIPVFMLVLTGNYSEFEKSLSTAVNELFKDVACDADGEPLNDTVDIIYRNPPTKNHSPYTMNFFRYDWREDIFDIADELNEYIELTKKLTGHDKVALKAASMGGAVVMTYLYVYGSESIDTLVMQSSASNGITLIGYLYKGEVNIKGQSVLNYISDFIQGDRADRMLYRALLLSFGKLIINPLADVLDKVLFNVKDDLYSDSFVPMIAWIPGLWVFVPFEDYEEAKHNLLDENINAKLIEKTDNYQYNVATYGKDILDAAIAGGMKFAIISHYGKAGVPLTVEDGYNSDFLIDTERTSFGATCAEYGETLGDGYVQKIDDGHNHLSCDGVIDASTCAYPEYTWFIKDMIHTWYSKGYMRFVYDLIYYDGQPTIDTFEEYPQFMLDNKETDELDILTVDNADTLKTDIDIIGLIRLISTAVKSK